MFAGIFQNTQILGNCGFNINPSIFSFQLVPSLLLYFYIPTALIALLLGFFIIRKNGKQKISFVFFIFTLLFSLWVFDIILQWIFVRNQMIFSVWQLRAVIEVGLYLSAFYLLILFVSKEKFLKSTNFLNTVLLILVALLTPSVLNMKSYDYNSCQGTIGTLWYLIYGFEIFVSVVILAYGFAKARKIENVQKKREANLFVSALALFFGIFTISNILRDIFHIFSFNIFGPIGVLIFIGLVTYLIVEYKSFNVKLISAQVLIWGLAILVGAELFFARTITNYIIISITFLGIIVFGQRLIRSVKREIKQKEELLILNTDLKNVIQQKESLMHLVTHKVKGSFTRSKYIFDGMLTNMFGKLTPEMEKIARIGFESNTTGVETVDLILNASNLERGRIKYDMKVINMKDIVLDSLDERKERAEKKKLDLELEAIDKEYKIKGDIFWLKEVVDNLIENSIRYTKTGTINISLKKNDGKILFAVKDTGVGITEEDKKNLFTEGGRGKESVKVNVDSTGYGLYTVKLVVEAHGGHVWAESEGAGKGSTFYLELPAV